MNEALRSLVERYAPLSPADWENALREIVQELALLGLWRSKFHEHAAFYGGTALRIFHGLRRFSGDMDFSLTAADPDLDMSPWLEAVRTELASFGFSFEVERKAKLVETAIESAFIKGNTRMNLLRIGAPDSLPVQFARSRKMKIKLEVDTDPPSGAEYEVKTLLVPIPFQMRLFTLPCLLAGKLHAVLCRNWKQRVKGRDFYDFLWYVGKDVPCHLLHLQKRMEQTGHWSPGEPLDLPGLKRRLNERFDAVDFQQAASDVRPFVRDPDELSLWSRDFFIGLTERLRAV